MKQKQHNSSQIQIQLSQKLSNVHIQLDLILQMVTNNEKYHEIILDKNNLFNSNHINNQIKFTDLLSTQSTNIQYNNDISEQSSQSTPDENDIQIKNTRLVSTISSQSQLPIICKLSLAKLTQNHLSIFQSTIKELQSLYINQCYQLIQQQMKIQYQSQLYGYLQQYTNKIQQLQYILDNKQNSIINDRMIKKQQQVLKTNTMKNLIKYLVEFNNIINLCAKIRVMKSQIYQHYREYVGYQQNNGEEILVEQQQRSSNKQHLNKQNITNNNNNNTKIKPYSITFNQFQKTKIANDPKYQKILQLIKKQNTRTLTLKKQYQSMIKQYKLIFNNNKIFKASYQQYHHTHIFN